MSFHKLNSSDLSKQDRVTTSGIKLENCYKKTNCDDVAYSEELPGKYPFTRGIYSEMYRKRLWTMRQYAGFGTAIESNERYKYLLDQGTTGLSVAFDLPTQIGLDSDSPLALGEVGKVGVAIDSLEDMEVLFSDIPLDKVSTSMTINSTAAILLALYIAVAKKQNISLSSLNGTVQNDILKEYIARGTYIYPPRHALRLITNLFEYCSREVPNWNTISISGYHMREAGCTAAQEIAFTLANAICYVESAVSSGLAVDEFAPRLSFFFNAHNNLFEEIAKFRAARRMWACIMRERFKAQDPKSWMLRFHTQTAGSTLTAQQPEVNVVRTTIQAIAAVLGGTQSLHTNSKDEALGLPTKSAVQVALRTQQVIAYESGISDVADPLGGSYLIEHLTNELEQIALDYIKKIDEIGGMLNAIEKGYPQKEIQHAAYNFQRSVETNEAVIIGINSFVVKQDEKIPILHIDPRVEASQIERLKKLRLNRDQVAVLNALNSLRLAAQSSANLMPHILQAVECYCTVGEISDCMRSVFGEYQEVIVF